MTSPGSYSTKLAFTNIRGDSHFHLFVFDVAVMPAKVYLTSSTDNVVATYNSMSSITGSLVLSKATLQAKFSVTDTSIAISSLLLGELD